MVRIITILVVLVFTAVLALSAELQKYDLLIRGGHLIDPKNQLDGPFDVAILDGKIARVGSGILHSEAEKVVDARGLFIVPGLIDVHAHVFFGTEENAAYSNGYSALSPDGFTFRSGVTTIVDAGGAGWRNFPQLKRQTIDHSQTRVLAFLNIVGSGMKGGPGEQDLRDMDSRLTALRVREFAQFIVGVKVAHYTGPGWEAVDRAVEAGRLAEVPVMVDFGRHTPPLPLKDLFLAHLRPGDIYSHAYAQVEGRESLVGEEGKVRPFVWDARRRGIIFDVGHGAGSLVFRQAVPAVKEGLYPDIISTDLHARSMNGGMKDLLNVASKFLNMGIPLRELVLRTTWNPARMINREDLGHLSEEAVADVTILAVRDGDFGFLDVDGYRMSGTSKLECEFVLRAGEVVWDLNGLAGMDWNSSQ
jgi:dihydroorotase